MPRYRLTLEYDGGPYVGWQRQENGPSVQAALERALLAFTQQPIGVMAAGRTDAGVHAAGQVVHFDCEKNYPADTVRDAINFHLKPDPVAVLDAAETGPEFHARFDALKRHYEYRILNRRPPPALDRGRVWHVAQTLDADAMDAAAKILLGEHDFTTFRAVGCQAQSPVKTLDRLDVMRAGQEVLIRASARSFLQHQVRSFAGSLAQVGLGRWRPWDLEGALKAKDRTACGPVAPPHGLTLVRVDYPAAAGTVETYGA